MAIISGTILALKGAGALMAKKTAAVTAKGAAGAVKAKAKDFVKGKIKGKIKSIAKDKLLGGRGGSGGGGGLVKMGSIGGSLVKTETTNTVKQEANIAAAGRSGSNPLLNEVIEIKITTIQIKDLLASNLAKQKAADAAARKQAEKDRKAEKEAQLESGAGGGGGRMKMPKGPKVGPFEAIKRFLLMTFLGALLAFLLKHHKKVLAVFKLLTKNITATIKIYLALRKLFRLAVAKLFQGAVGLARKLGGSTFNAIKKAIKSTGTIIFDALKTAGNALFDFLKATIEAALKFADDVAKAVTQLGRQLVQRANQIRTFVQKASKAAYDAVRSGKGFTGAVDAVKKTSQEMAEEAAERAVQESGEKLLQESGEKLLQEGGEKVVQEGGEKLLQEGGEKLLQEGGEKLAKEVTEEVIEEVGEKVVQEGLEKVAKEATEEVVEEVIEKVAQEGLEQVATKAGQGFFSRIPFLGGLITCIVSLASGEPVSQALFKTAGALFGGFLGSFIPIPVIGSLIGELLGEYVGDLFYTALMGGGMDAVGKKLQEDITSLLKAGKFVADWIGDGFGRLNEGIPSYLGVKNYLVLFNPIESVPLFYKAFFTRDSMTEKEEKEPEVEQKFFGGIVNAAKDFLGMGSTEDGGMSMGSISSSGNVKEPKKLPGLSLTKIPLKNSETYIGVRFKNDVFSGGLGSIFGGLMGGDATDDLATMPPGTPYTPGVGPELGSSNAPAIAKNAHSGFKRIYNLAKQAGDPFPEVTAAQWAIESGYGSSKTGKNNPFGQTGRHPKYGGTTLATPRDPGGGSKTFMNFGSEAEAVAFRVKRWVPEYGNAKTPYEALMNIQKHGGNMRYAQGFPTAAFPNGDWMGYVRSVSRVIRENGMDPQRKAEFNNDPNSSPETPEVASVPASVPIPPPETTSEPPAAEEQNNEGSTPPSNNDSPDPPENKAEIKKVYNPDGTLNFNKTFIHKDLLSGGTFGAGLSRKAPKSEDDRGEGEGQMSKPEPSMMKIGSSSIVARSPDIASGSNSKVARSFNAASGSNSKVVKSLNIAPAQKASFGSVNVKNYQIQESAHYDEPSAQIIIMPPPQQPSRPQRRLSSNGGKNNGVLPLFPLNRDINDIVSQAAFY